MKLFLFLLMFTILGTSAFEISYTEIKAATQKSKAALYDIRNYRS